MVTFAADILSAVGDDEILGIIVLNTGWCDGEERLKEMDPRIDGNYAVFATRRDKCILCDKCLDVCPVDAIKIEVA